MTPTTLMTFMTLWVFAPAAAFIPPALPPAHAAPRPPLILEGEAVPGGLMEGRSLTRGSLSAKGAALRVCPDGRFFLGFTRNVRVGFELVFKPESGGVYRRKMRVGKRVYDEQHIDGLPAPMVTPSPKALERIARERSLIKKAKKTLDCSRRPQLPMTLPLEGIISGVYGSRRILNGEPRRPHLGLDIAAPLKTPVRAPAAGLVTLAERDMYFNGHIVMLDHGGGLATFYAHLHGVNVSPGDIVEAGWQLGTVGMSGRATGPHLHWGAYLGNAALDPALLLGAEERLKLPPSALPAPDGADGGLNRQGTASGDESTAIAPGTRESSRP